MASANVVIANYSISHLGIGKTISSLTENTREAKVCNLFYDEALKVTLRKLNPPWARKRRSLSLVTTDPTTEWGYEYIYPTDCVNFLRIESGLRNETLNTKIKFQIFQNESGVTGDKVIRTDQSSAVGIYTKFDQTTSHYPSDFAIALSYILASMIAPQITKGGGNLRNNMLKFFQLWGDEAWASALNEEQPDEQPDSDYVSVRE